LKWFKKIFQKDKSEDNARSFRLSDLDTWLDEKSNQTLSEERLSEIYSGIENLARDLDRDRQALAVAEPEDNAPPRLLKAGLAARGEVVKQIESLTRKLQPPTQWDAQSVSEHHWALVKALGNTVTKFGRAQRYVAALFPKESESINSDLNRLSRLLVQLEEETSKKRKEREEIWYSKELVSKIKESIVQIADLRASIERDEERLSLLRDEEGQLDAKVKQLASSAEGRRAIDLKKTLDLKREELKGVEAEIADLVAPLTKALIRVMKQEASDRISLQHREVLETLSRSPLLALDGDISEPLQEMRSHLATLGLKDRKKEKTLEHLDYLIDKRPLEALKARHKNLSEEITDLEEQLAESTREAEILKKDLVLARKEIKRLEPELVQSRGRLAAVEEKASRDEAELKDRVGRLAGGPVEIDFGQEEDRGRRE
jgi:DNA repair exonuclease SbcCD ATPase subunit